MLFSLALTTFCLTVFVVPLLAWWHGRLPYFPIQLSKCATFRPMKSVFAAGLTLTSLLLVPSFLSQDHYAFGLAACLFMPLVGLVSEKNNAVKHTLFAALAMGCLGTHVLMLAGPTPAWMLAVAFNALNTLSAIPLLQFRITGSVGTIPFDFAFQGELPEPYVPFLLRLRGVLQWIAIAALMVALSETTES